LSLLEGGSDSLIVLSVDVGGEDAVDNLEARLAVERRVGGGEATDTVFLSETTTKTPVEVARMVKDSSQH
jgi:hypothetical protein